MTLGIGAWRTVMWHLCQLHGEALGLVPAVDKLRGKRGRESRVLPVARSRQEGFTKIIAITIKSKRKAFKWNYCQRQKGTVAGVGVCTAQSWESIYLRGAETAEIRLLP